MKIIYNSEYGGFSWPREIVEEFGLHAWNDDSRANRTKPEIVSRIEQIIQSYVERERQYIDQRKHTSFIIGVLTGNQLDEAIKDNVATDLRIATIPDDATDWMVSDYDGLETIYFVKNGKLYYATDDGLGALVNGEE